LGRVLTYTVLGGILGWLGSRFSLFGWQQGMSVVLGCVMLLFFLAALFHKRLLKNTWLDKYWNKHIIRLIAPLFKRKSFISLFLIGSLNGLLPCGLVYMAVAGAMATGTAVKGAAFMAMFGLGTMPAMAAVSFAGNIISIGFRNKIRKATPFVIGIIGLLLIIRGLNLNIPYLSPQMKEDKVECCHR